MFSNLRIERLSAQDAIRCSDDLRSLQHLLLGNETMYPGIDTWVREKVIPGLRDSSRVAYIGYVDERPRVSAVVRKGPDAKICHLRVADDLQDSHLGELFFCLMLIDVREQAHDVHFTLPESLWCSKHDFFQGFGFRVAQPANVQYRMFDRELRCSADFQCVWKSVISKLPRMAELFYPNTQDSWRNAILMSIQPKYAERILSGQKSIEVRRRFNSKWVGSRVSIYASKPKGCLVGEARISRVVPGKPEMIWKAFGHWMGCAEQEFRDYAQDSDEVYAIALTDVHPYERVISLEQMARTLNTRLRPPQSYCRLENDLATTSVASILLNWGSLFARGKDESEKRTVVVSINPSRRNKRQETQNTLW